ncbi:MAG: bifunctional (p)ppGpp synthetase/guanosine-3',5'-bis(diphosphate) 3'-pyrophosphohydrolase [Saprospiraceae bacterium]|nr:bifunctional (p)ppGpp synthetase/guanosine-3',5'-bis(diphosphate) 3'-pyrophosphohydrolase [Saprospiraceae bacterium]
MIISQLLDIPEFVWPQSDQHLIRTAYRKLFRSINQSKISDLEKKDVRRAFEFALKAHGSQRRKSGEPYITHPLEVARICFEEFGLGFKSVIGALLHDVVEDTPVTIDQVRTEFGDKIGQIVDGLTKLDGLYNVESPQAENFKKVLSTLVDDVRVILIKMADRLHNLRTIDAMSKHKQLRIAAETSFIYAPLAHRLGLYSLKSEFQDICLKITEPDIYKQIASRLLETQKERNKFITEFIKPIKTKLDQLNIPYRIFGRPKSISSIANKIKSKRVKFEEIYDLFAIRIIVDVPKDLEKTICWQIYSIVTDVHKPIPERLRDWITTPRANGYESLHTTVISKAGKYVEVQIRSERMDDIAEKGYASHWKYKGVSNIHGIYDHWFNSIKDVLETPHNDAIEFLNDFKANLYGEEVYVYTPKGDMIVLPKGATALDFAFYIHSDVGIKTNACKINNKLVPFGYELVSGDQIMVITSTKQKPTEDWLKMVTTSKAKSKIRSALKEEQKIVSEYGKEILERKFKSAKIPLEENMEIILKSLGYKNKIDLFVDIHNGVQEWQDLIKNFNIEGSRLIPIKNKESAKEDESESKEKTYNTTGKLIINGEDAKTYKYSLASCCSPVQGDDIFAYVTSGSGVRIHRINCKNAQNLMVNYSYRILKAEWTHSKGDKFTADLMINGIDEGVGVIERISHTISSVHGVNIRSFSIMSHEGTFEGKVSIVVSNKDHIDQIVNSLLKVKGISSVVRDV